MTTPISSGATPFPTLELLGHYGGDRTHALSAWTSTSRDLTPEKEARIPALLAQLAADGHHTPFEKSALHFLVATDIATHVHILKHRVGVSVNAESARYREFRDDNAFHVPADWPADAQAALRAFNAQAASAYHDAVESLVAAGVPRKRAKESARYFLPYSKVIRADVLFNFRSFMHFMGLRNSPHAQVEVRDLAAGMLAAVRDIPGAPFAASLAAFGYA